MSETTVIRSALKPYVTLADLLVCTFGESCEVVVHDLTIPEHSVVYVANGIVTLRKVGDSFEHLITEMLQSDTTSKDMLANYFFEHNNRKIRSSSLIIRDEFGRIEGALCINIDTEQDLASLNALRALTARLEARLHPEKSTADSAKTFDNDDSVESFVFNFIDRVVGDNRAQNLTRPKRLALVNYLDKKGVFLLKGALEYAAGKLGLSRVTLYSDLDTVRKTKQ